MEPHLPYIPSKEHVEVLALFDLWMQQKYDHPGNGTPLSLPLLDMDDFLWEDEGSRRGLMHDERFTKAFEKEGSSVRLVSAVRSQIVQADGCFLDRTCKITSWPTHSNS